MTTPTKPKRGRPRKPKAQRVVPVTIALRPADWSALDTLRNQHPLPLSRSGAVAWLIQRATQPES